MNAAQVQLPSPALLAPVFEHNACYPLVAGLPCWIVSWILRALSTYIYRLTYFTFIDG